MFKFIYNESKDFSKEINRCDISSYAASSAFFLVLSLPPIAILICAIIPYTSISIDNLFVFMKDMFPAYIIELVSSIIYEFSHTRIALISISALITLWASGKGIFALMRGLNVINNVEEKRNVIVLRLIACLYLMALLLLTLLSLIFLVYGNKLTDAILFRIPELRFIYAFILNFRFLLFWVGFMILFIIFYTLLPNKKMNIKQQLPGALIASVCWSLFSWGFSIYVDVYDGFSMYGSLTTIIVTMFWLYFCMYMILFGAIINLRYQTIMENFRLVKAEGQGKKKSKSKNGEED